MISKKKFYFKYGKITFILILNLVLIQIGLKIYLVKVVKYEK